MECDVCELRWGGSGLLGTHAHTALLRAFPAGDRWCPGGVSLLSPPPPVSAVMELIVIEGKEKIEEQGRSYVRQTRSYHNQK